MLLPGAIYPISFILGLIGIILSLGIGCLIGAGFYRISRTLIQRTKAWEKYVQGHKNADRWWFEIRKWYLIGAFIGTAISAYSLAGPICTLIRYLGGS
jgi:hypothetical protein